MLLFRNNNLRSIGLGAFRNNSTSLKLIDLSQNHIHLDSTSWLIFYDIASLHILLLEYNDIETMPTTVGESKKFELIALNLRHNQIRVVHGDALFSTPFQSIDLSHNPIEIIYPSKKKSSDLYLSVNVHRILVLGSYSIVCNSTLIDFVERRPKQSYMWHDEGLRCAEPWAMRDRLIADVKVTELLTPLAIWLKTECINATAICPTDCNCWVQPTTGTLLVNCSHIVVSTRIDVPPLPDPLAYHLNGTELWVQHNRIERLPLIKADDPYMHVTIINASHNRIDALMAANIPPALRSLDLRHNRLRTLDASVLDALGLIAVRSVWLDENPWQCDCSTIPWLEQLQCHSRADYLAGARCAGNKQLLKDVQLSEICNVSYTWIWVGLIAALSVAVPWMLFCLYGSLLRVWLLGHPWLSFLLCAAVDDDDDEPVAADGSKRYDAFVSYSHLDDRIVIDHLVPELEQGDPQYRLCIHERDWMVGGFITESVSVDSAEGNREVRL